MASIFADSSNGLPRSHSSSNIPDLSPVEFGHTRPGGTTVDIPRAASYACLPAFESLSYTSEKDTLQAHSSAAISAESGISNGPNEREDGSGRVNCTSIQEERSKLDRIGRRKSLVARPKSWIQRVTGSPERKTSVVQSQSQAPNTPAGNILAEKSKKPPGSFATFARKTWISSSRSPSPSNRTGKDQDDSTLEESGSILTSSILPSSPQKSSALAPKSEKSSANNSSSDHIKGLTRKGTTLKKSKRSQSELINANAAKLDNASTGSLPLGMEETPRGSTDIPPVPKGLVKEKLASFGIEPPRKKDELWSAFRSLETDFQKFKSKSNALRANVVRSTLLPFLRNHAQHPSNKNLRPEDIDRRVAILNKWWTGLLEMLDGHNNQYVSGIDRPVLLDAITGIMMRPEWRLAPSYFAPVAERASPCPIPQSRSSSSLVPRSRSSNSLNSSASQFLAESVYHNVRNNFIHNLLSQMSTVVDKMSLRNAPASLVSFCGKAVAYAFFFCPGVAEILVRIWGLSSETIRRVADEFSLVRHVTGSASSEDFVLEFPPNLHSLGWKSLKSLLHQLRERPDIPLGATKIDWYGPWVARWCGRDSDLLFVFCKHYHILTEEFLPSDLPLIEKARAPAVVLVHAQILATLDATIHRQASGDTVTGPFHVTFEDVLSGADASAAALPLPPSSNVTRLMAENRLIMLLRDFMSERPSEFHAARHTFAEAFSIIMRAAARRTSQFDHNACFFICDFIEEALVIYMRFQNNLEIPTEYIDWRFWLGVCQKMLESQNSMTEIRLFSFIFGAWNLVTSDDQRKETICLDWLLSEDTFRKYFLHWCPMVRAYYMRLLCWRVCRFDGEATQLDAKIFSNISNRLKTVWSYYLWQKQAAEKDGKLPPPTVACYPAPGRRLLIIRNDNQIPTTSLFLGFDGLLNQTAGTPANAYKRHSSLATVSLSNSTDYNISESSNQKKRWSLLGKVIPFTTPDATSQSQDLSSTAPKPSPLEKARTATAAARTRPNINTQHHNTSSSSINSDSTPSTPTHRAFSFKFSLEWAPPLHQVLLHPQNLGPNHRPSTPTKPSLQFPSQNRRLLPPRLPGPAQTWLVCQIPTTVNEVAPLEPASTEAKYAGRALAEWALVVMECNNFVERRRAEGVPTLKLLEVPTLGVEGFRKLG